MSAESFLNLMPGTARAHLLAVPERLHPAVWRARGQGPGGAGVSATLSTGFAALDHWLPGRGWPLRVLVELLLPQSGLGEFRLLAPVLARLGAAGRSVLLFNPPAVPSAPALVQMGLEPARCVLVCPPGVGVAGSGMAARHAASRSGLARPVADLCWALEQTLRSGQAGAVLAWLGPQVGPAVLRRLQLAAQAQPGPVFLLREAAEAARPSPAALRLALAPDGADALVLQVLKQRGACPPATGLRLSLLPVLSDRARARSLAPRGVGAVPARMVRVPDLADGSAAGMPVFVQASPG